MGHPASPHGAPRPYRRLLGAPLPRASSSTALRCPLPSCPASRPPAPPSPPLFLAVLPALPRRSPPGAFGSTPGSSRTGRRRQPHLPAPRPHLTGLISIPPALRHAIGPSFPFVYISGREGTSERLSARQWAGLRAYLHIGRAQRLPPLSPRGAGAGGAAGGGRSGVRTRRYRSRVRAAGRDPGPSLSSQARVTLTGFRTELLVLLYSYVSVVSCPRCWLRVMAA